MLSWRFLYMYYGGNFCMLLTWYGKYSLSKSYTYTDFQKICVRMWYIRTKCKMGFTVLEILKYLGAYLPFVTFGSPEIYLHISLTHFCCRCASLPSKPSHGLNRITARRWNSPQNTKLAIFSCVSYCFIHSFLPLIIFLKESTCCSI